MDFTVLLPVLDTIINFLQTLATNNATISGLIVIVYSVGLALTLILEAAKKYVNQSPSKSDDVWFARLEEKKIYKAVLFVLNLFVRLRIK